MNACVSTASPNICRLFCSLQTAVADCSQYKQLSLLARITNRSRKTMVPNAPLSIVERPSRFSIRNSHKACISILGNLMSASFDDWLNSVNDNIWMSDRVDEIKVKLLTIARVTGSEHWKGLAYRTMLAVDLYRSLFTETKKISVSIIWYVSSSRQNLSLPDHSVLSFMAASPTTWISSIIYSQISLTTTAIFLHPGRRLRRISMEFRDFTNKWGVCIRDHFAMIVYFCSLRTLGFRSESLSY